MKNIIPVRYVMALLAGFAVVMATGSAYAQDEARGRGGRGGAGFGGFGIPDVTEEQTALLTEMNTGLADQTAKVTDARTAVAAAVHAEKVDEAAIKAKVADLAKAEEALALARAAAFAKIRSKFNADQITAIQAQSARGIGGRGFGGRGGQGGRGRGQQ